MGNKNVEDKGVENCSKSLKEVNPIDEIITNISADYIAKGNKYSKIYVEGLHELISLLGYKVGLKLYKSKYKR